MLLSYLRTVILYLVLIAVIRLMGKRQLGQLEPAEFVVTMLVANLASIPMQDSGIPLLSGFVPILTVLGVELVLSYLSLRSIKVRRSGASSVSFSMNSPSVMPRNLAMRAISASLTRTMPSLMRQHAPHIRHSKRKSFPDSIFYESTSTPP